MRNLCRILAFGAVLAHSALASAADLDFLTERFRLRFNHSGQPASLVDLSSEAELGNPGHPGLGFYLTSGTTRIPLNDLSLDDRGRLVARSTDAATVAFNVRSTARYLVLTIDELRDLPSEPPPALHFEMNSTPRVRVADLDYLTQVQNETYGVRAHWNFLRQRPAAEPPGGFAVYIKNDDDDEDELLLHLWCDEHLPHPRIQGEWTVDRARQWLADWQSRFADRSQMILEGDSLDELRAALPYAERAAIRDIYLFTQTWRSDGFWPKRQSHIHVNRSVFPDGEDDLRGFSDFLEARGMRLNLHYVSGGIGPSDPTLVGSKPDPRLASWGRGKTLEPIDDKARDIVVGLDHGVAYPPNVPEFFQHNQVRIGNEIVRVGAFEERQPGRWLLKNCQRGLHETKAVSHAPDTAIVGLISAYGQNFVPDNDSTLLDEMAADYARFINRCRIANTEYDGAEIHCYNGGWGFQKFATKVYEQLDHPVTAHDSTGRVPRCYFEYRFNSSRRLMRGSCIFTHGNWIAPFELASRSRVASTLLDAHFVLSQGHLGGAMGIGKPEPLFAVSERVFKSLGLTDPLIDTLLDWKAASTHLTPEQHAMIDAYFAVPTGRFPQASRHRVARHVPVVRKCDRGYEIVPVCVMTRPEGDILWQQGQEHGAISPRQYLKPGDSITLENPFDPQPATFIVRVLWAFDPAGKSIPLAAAAAPSAPGVKPSDLFTTGNADASSSASPAEPNYLIQPPRDTVRQPASITVAAEGDGLRLAAANPDGKDRWEFEDLPTWGCNVDLASHRGIGMDVTGDGSGATLLFQIPGRDYVVPIDFDGRRYFEIPNGEVAWSRGDWGWRMATKKTDYTSIRWMKLGFGRIPPATNPGILVENLTALAEVPTQLVNPTIHIADGTLSVDGAIPSNHYLRYDGGSTATVYDENWNRLRDLPVRLRGYVMPAGRATVSIATAQSQPRPWLEVQFLTAGPPETIPVPRR